MITVNLEEPNSLPTSFLNRLRECNRFFEKELYLDRLREIPAVSKLIQEIDEYCIGNMVCGFHYTRAIREDILSSGLRVRTGREIRAEFLYRFGYMFSPKELMTLNEAWESYFDKSMSAVRDNRIFFNFTTNSLHNGGADPLLRNYGGEQVYFCIKELPDVGEKISAIGQPLIVKCSLKPKQLNTYMEHPWGSIAVSSYHRSVNPDAYQADQDGWQFVPVPPKRIELILL